MAAWLIAILSLQQTRTAKFLKEAAAPISTFQNTALKGVSSGPSSGDTVRGSVFDSLGVEAHIGFKRTRRAAVDCVRIS